MILSCPMKGLSICISGFEPTLYFPAYIALTLAKDELSKTGKSTSSDKETFRSMKKQGQSACSPKDHTTLCRGVHTERVGLINWLGIVGGMQYHVYVSSSNHTLAQLYATSIIAHHLQFPDMLVSILWRADINVVQAIIQWHTWNFSSQWEASSVRATNFFCRSLSNALKGEFCRATLISCYSDARLRGCNCVSAMQGLRMVGCKILHKEQPIHRLLMFWLGILGSTLGFKDSQQRTTSAQKWFSISEHP